MQSQSKIKLFAIGAAVIVVLILITVFVSSGKQPKPSDTTVNPVPNTPTAGTVVTNPDQAVTPSTTNVDISELKSNGLSVRQLDSLQAALYRFASANGKDIKKVTVVKSSIKHSTPGVNSGTYSSTYSFTISFGDNVNYSANLTVSGLSAVRLTLYTPNTTNLIYDSQTIDSTKL